MRTRLRRREFIRAVAAGAAAVGARTGRVFAQGRPAVHNPTFEGVRKSAFSTTETPTPWDTITSYNNFYEFAGSDNKDLPSLLAPDNLETKPWQVTVDGHCGNRGAFDLDEILGGAPLEERIYRHRCVEGWSMVIPWVGIPLASFVARCKPTAAAKFVRFDAHYDRERMPRSRRLPFDWPYTEGLRLDEAVHPLTLLAVGLYGEPLPHQNGAPIRLVVPWKYGFKSIKSIKRISFVTERPVGTYEQTEPDVYGFYSNVNPNVGNKRWNQKTEARIGELFRRKTLMFNGYAKEVAALYKNMDLRANY